MLLQSLLLVVTLAIVGSALLTSTLVTAKSSFHSLVLRQSRSAMTDATASFISWAQTNMKQNGIDQLPIWAAKPPTLATESTCNTVRHAVTSGPPVTCKLYRRVAWNTTGYSDIQAVMSPNTTSSLASNLATAQNERRISATIAVAITDSTGTITYSRQSREITARLFHAFPYVALTGERDSAVEAGSIAAAEGDTAGFNTQLHQTSFTADAPTISSPATFNWTTLLTTTDCINSPNNSFANAQLDDNNVIFARVRGYGNLAWSYEVPCQPTQAINPSTAPNGYVPPTNSVYRSGSVINARWNKNDANLSTFPR